MTQQLDRSMWGHLSGLDTAEPEPSSGGVERQCDGSQVFQFGGPDAKTKGLCAKVEEVVDEELPLRPVLKGIKRVIWAVVTPDSRTDNRTILILGLPWLYDVGAKIDVRKSELILGVEEEGDVTSIISGPLMAMSGR
ncbi:hypothetical protein E4U61_000770 [Claviceps capensis]|nr:hypothetical protein E4U61_000770 [Claviceps capensis]